MINTSPVIMVYSESPRIESLRSTFASRGGHLRKRSSHSRFHTCDVARLPYGVTIFVILSFCFNYLYLDPMAMECGRSFDSFLYQGA